MTTINKEFIINNLLTKTGQLKQSALKKFNISDRDVYLILNDLSESPKCKTCGNITPLISLHKGFRTFCSNSCVGKNKDIQKQKHNSLVERYGLDPWKSQEILNKKKITSLKNFGVEHAAKTPEFQQRLKETCMSKYGVSHISHHPDIQEKKRKTNQEKYGCDNPHQSPLIKERTAKTNIQKYGVKSVLQLEENRNKAYNKRINHDSMSLLNDKNWLEKNKDVPSTILSEQLNVAWSTVLNYFKKHKVERSNVITSKVEIEIANFLDQNDIKYIKHDRTILNGKEIDIFIPDLKIGIEFNGLYWHSESFISNKNYHANKTFLAMEKQVQLIHILDYEWNNFQPIVENRILAKCNKLPKIYARKCEVITIDDETYTNFINKTHIQQKAAASVRIALVNDNEIVAVMSFAKPRYNKNYQWELIRYSSTNKVLGGASKLFKWFIDTYKPSSIISYSDLRWNTGSVYTSIGMTHLYNSKPNYWYIKNGRMEHRTMYQKHKLKQLLDTFDPTLTEWENMKLNGFTRYWDCGNAVYGWKND